MLRISKQVDYGILLLACCARGDGGAVHNARDLASETGLPLPMVGKVLKALARDGILVSHRGTKGGYSLVREAEQISVASIVRALEGPIRLVDCDSTATADHAESCRLRGSCDVVAPLRSLATAVRELFERVTLAELLEDRLGVPQTRSEDDHRTPDPDIDEW